MWLSKRLVLSNQAQRQTSPTRVKLRSTTYSCIMTHFQPETLRFFAKRLQRRLSMPAALHCTRVLFKSFEALVWNTTGRNSNFVKAVVQLKRCKLSRVGWGKGVVGLSPTNFRIAVAVPVDQSLVYRKVPRELFFILQNKFTL